jgi:sulfur-oxidizing protein SoxY
MDNKRRSVVQSLGALGLFVTLGLITERQALAAAARPGFDQTTFDGALKAIGATSAVDSKDIHLVSPDIAENGAVVPVAVTSAIPNTEKIVILVENNPNPLSASFTIPPGTAPSLQTRVKMGGSSNIVALVKADGKLYKTSRETKVTLGGCGG